jgi:drug/metabolite transporter (DMT)-like permease
MLKKYPWLAPSLFIFIWATGYIAAKFGAIDAEPLTFLSYRYVFVLLLMLALALLSGAKWPSTKQAWHLAVAGIGIQAVYLGGVWVAIRQGLPSGLAALIVNLQPVLTAALAVLVHERVSGRQWLGVVLGFSGVVLVVWEKLQLSASLTPVLLCVASLVGITLGTLYQKRFVPSFDLRTGQVVQFSASLLVTLPLMFWFETGQMRWTMTSVLSMMWSVFILTGVGISLMFYMLRTGLATRVTAAMYLVPAVTAIMAWLAFGERISALAILGMLVTLVGVWLVARSK